MNDKKSLSKSDLFNEFLKDPERKPLYTIIPEIISLFIIHHRFPRHYFARYLFKKGKANIKDYFPNDFLYKKIKPFLNDKDCRDVLENKLYFNFFYCQFKIALPKILMYNHKMMFVADDKYFQINNAHAFKILLEELFLKDPTRDSIIIKRTYWSYGGDKVYKLFRHQLATDPERITWLYDEVIKAGFLFQETVKQHPELNRLNPSCLNTIRFDTFIDKEGKIEIISGYIRMSINNLHVDNISSGGCQVGIDLQSGKLRKDGYGSFSSLGVKVLKAHPVTKTTFENFIIPFFDQAKELVLRAASFMPGLRIVGWDVAIGESGPILIEGNSDYDLAGNDLSEGGYRSNETFRKVLHEINYL